MVKSLFVQEIMAICSNYQGKKCYVRNIPDNVLNMIRKKFDISLYDEIMAFYDDSIFGEGKQGLIICDNGLHWKVLYSKTFIPWNEFANISNIFCKKDEIILDSKYEFTTFDFPIPLEDLIELLTQLRDCANKWKNQHTSNPTFVKGQKIESTTTKSFKDEIIQICTPYAGKECHIDTIPKKIEYNIQKHFNIPSTEHIFVFFDFTVFNTGKKGIAIGESGLYFKEILDPPIFISWDQFEKINDIRVEKNDIKLDHYSFFVMDTVISLADAVELMIQLRDCARKWHDQRSFTTPLTKSHSKETFTPSFMDEIFLICSPYQGDERYVGNIPQQTEQNMRKHFNIPSTEQVVALFDFSIFNSGKNGIAFSESGLYIKKTFGPSTLITWEQLAKVKNIKVERSDIQLDHYSIYFLNNVISIEEALELMISLRDCAQKWYGVQNQETTVNVFTSDDEFTNHNLNLEQTITKLCNLYKRNKVYVNSLPNLLREQLYSNFQLDQKIKILAYFDFTRFGIGHDGVIFTLEGIHWKVDTKGFIAWNSLDLNAIHADDSTLYLCSDQELPLDGSPLSSIEWINILKTLNEVFNHEQNQSVENSSSFISLKNLIKSQLKSYQKIQLEPFTASEKNHFYSLFNLPIDIECWAYVDFSNSKPSKDGVLFTEFGIYFGKKETLFISWNRLLQSEIYLDYEKNQIMISDDLYLFTQQSPIPKEDWLQLLMNLQSLPELQELSINPLHTVRVENDDGYDPYFIEALARNNAFLNKFVDYSFSKETEERARLSYRLLDEEEIVAYHPGDTKSKGELGLLLTSRGMYIANPIDSKLKPRVFIPFKELQHIKLSIKNKSLFLDEEIYKEGNVEALLALIHDITLYVESTKALDFPVEFPYDSAYAIKLNLPVQSKNPERWIIALDGMLQGIYSTTEIHWAIDTNQLDPLKIKLWKKDLSRWIDLIESDILSKR